MILSDLYQLLTADDKIQPGDQWTLASLAGEHIWAPCDSFVGKRAVDVQDRGRILLRRPIAKDVVT